MEKKIKTPQDLKAFRDRARADIDLRTGEKEMRILVHMGTCGIAAGARDVLSRVLAEIESAGAGNVTVRLSGCLGLCDREPMMTLIDKSGREFCYGPLDAAKVHEIVSRHVLGGEPASEYMVSAG
jgi:NADP-reducing hydrogenase subunit HndB